MPQTMKWLSLAIVALSLSACVTAHSEPAAPAAVRPAPTAVRIPLVTYTRTQQAQLADEIERSTIVDLWPDMITDYGRTRRAICAAEGWKQPACRLIQSRQGAT